MDVQTARFKAEYLRILRDYFYQNQVLEVQTSALRPEAVIDAHIDLFTWPLNKGAYFLQSSPELAMKELLSKGYPSIYQIAPAFRRGEEGRWHHPHFTLLEWYRLNWSVEKLMDEVAEVAQLVLGPRPVMYQSYPMLFQNYCTLDVLNSSESEILNTIRNLGLPEPASNDHLDLLDHILSLYIIPKLPSQTLFFMTHYPASQAVLGKIDPQNKDLSLRFELVYEGVELANGWEECTDAGELLRRFNCEIEKQKKIGKQPQPLPLTWLSSIDKLPPCSGVALGLDRLFGLALELKEIARLS